MSAIPIQLSELFQLPNLGIPQNVISFSTVTMEGQYICVRDTAGTEKTIRIIDAQTQNVTTNKGNAVEAAIMHPAQKIIALRAGNTCQVFDLDKKQKLSQITMNEAVVFWKWVNDKIIAIVTQTAVYHWNYNTTEQPTKVFDRHASLESAQIINYRTDKKQQWLLLVGLVPGGETGFKGAMQLYSVERAVTQAIEGHAACFIDFALSSTYTTSLICIASASAQGGKLFIMEVPTAKPESAPQFQRKAVQVQFAPGDFPVAMQASDKHGLIFLLTKGGYLFLFDAETGTRIYSSRVSQEPIFVTAPYAPTNGVIGINRVGQVLSISVDENNIVPCINNMGMSDLAFKIATRAQLPGAIELYVTQFNALLQQQNIEEAIKLAVEAPNGVLRTPQTIQRLQKYPIQAPKPPLSIYFNMIIQNASLNKHESIELALLVLQKPQGAEYIKKLLGENKVEASEQLGDVLRQYNLDLAMSIYLKCQAHDRIIDCLIQKGEPAKVLRYCERVGFTPNYLDIFRKILAINPDEAVKYASELVPKKLLDGNVVVDVFVQANMIKQATHFLLDALKDDKPEDGALQTRLLEINLLYSPPQVADSILKQDMFHHFDKKRVAQLCEQVGLFLRALENFTDIADRKRVIVNCPYVQPDPTEWLVNFLGTLSPNDVLALLRELMKGGQRQNLNIVVQAASKYHEELTEQDPNALIALFEEYRSFEGLFYYLGSIVDYSKDPEVHFKYIQAAVKMGNIPEVVRITQESDIYDPVKTKEFLKESKLADLTPLMNVCDKHGYIEEMVTYFYNNQALKYIDMYVKQKNPLKTPNVIGALLDVDASEEFIKNLLLSVGQMCPIEPLVQEVEKRNRLKLLLPWLEARINEGNTEPATHNALAKIYIDLNNNPEQFLLNNQYYDPRVVGKYCEKRDPHLSFIAYKKGQCDMELVDVTNKNGMFKPQARYLVQRQNPELWAAVLGNPQYRRQIIDQVVQTALPETTNTEEVSSTVKAFIAAQLPNELIELLEQIVLHGSSEFKKNKNLQNLLILTAIRADTRRVMDYINRLDNYDAPDIAEIAVQKELYDEAFVIYSKFKLNTSAVRVLIERKTDIAAATEFADKVQENEVFSILGRAQLAHSLVPEAIASFLKSSDATSYHEVISAAQRTENFADLIKFLKMARAKVQDSLVDTELVYSLAKYAAQQNNTSGLADLEDFISSPNTAQIQVVGDRCFEEGLFEAARILFASISNWSRLAATYIKLSRHREAVNAALKANSIKTFKEVMASCIDANEFKLAQQCALNIITQADEIDDLVHYYEVRGYWEELIELLERGTSIERPPNAVFGSLALMYAKYRPEKLMDHITRHYKKLHIPRLINACEQNHLWAEMRFLLVIHEEFDQAIRVMIDHSSDAWDHTAFTDTILKVVNQELYYKSIQFYLEEQPQLVVDLLKVISQKLDNERVAREVKQNGNLALIKDYLVSIQDLNLQQVNEAVNFLYIEEEDYENLRSSIENHTNFDQVTLAKKLENHELLEFRRIASYLYKVKKQYQSSIVLSKKDKLYKDAIETAADSESQEVAEDLLKFFVENGLNECFAAALYTCYNLVRPDVALELSWRYKITDMAMPFLVQVLREYTSKVDELYRANKEAKQLQEAQMRQQELSVIQDPAQYAYAAVPIVDPNQYPPQAFPPQQTGWF